MRDRAKEVTRKSNSPRVGMAQWLGQFDLLCRSAWGPDAGRRAKLLTYTTPRDGGVKPHSNRLPVAWTLIYNGRCGWLFPPFSLRPIRGKSQRYKPLHGTSRGSLLLPGTISNKFRGFRGC